ncbi:hypothetical protein GJ744_000061 [Endocarpon pusillum]|uniref:Mitochondrial import inner membrane translocase subunit n=1 Tax=Endocarpon pusillum TaxID=364733 RepID=A0A8H7AW72_9EURO|nr:hypothetical protein GJ744_000061 [Endocarpon pusillum]
METSISVDGAVSKLTPQDQRELQQFVQNESQKNQIQSTVHDLTERCFKRCITGSLSAGKLTSKEEVCMQNCVERFMDTSLAVLKHLETLRAGQ